MTHFLISPVRALTCLTMMACAVPVFATLGEGVASVQSDQLRMKAQTRVLPNQSFSVHELRMPNNSVVREFVSAGGTVFGVAWQGPFSPDFRQLLGEHFDEYAQAAQNPANRRGRGLHIETDDLVFESSGHMRFLTGRAYLRSQIPQGTSSDAVR